MLPLGYLVLAGKRRAALLTLTPSRGCRPYLHRHVSGCQCDVFTQFFLRAIATQHACATIIFRCHNPLQRHNAPLAAMRDTTNSVKYEAFVKS